MRSRPKRETLEQVLPPSDVKDEMICMVTASGETRSLLSMEKDIIQAAIARHNSRMTDAALALSISRNTLYRKCRDYEI